MKGIRYWIAILCFSLFAFQAVKAQTVYAQVSSKQVQAGVPFEYAIVIKTNPNSYSPPAFNGLEVVGGPNQSSSQQWVNGQASFQMTLTWGLVAPKEGKYTIGVAAVVAGNQKFETQAVTIEAVKGAPAQGGNNGGDPHGAKVGGGDLFIRTSTSKNKCYLGEQITIVQKVYCRYQIIGFQKFSQPTYDGFYSQAQESTSKGQLAVENIDGVNYYTYELFRTVGIANKAGKINLSTIEGDVVVRRQSNAKPKNIFEQFFGAAAYEDTPVNVKSKPVMVEVMDLPEEGKPDSFNGAVGNFSSKVQVTRNDVKANDAFNLKMTISGKGNLKLVTPPKLNLPEGFETYDPKTTESATSKTFDYLIIPRNEGDYNLEKIDFSYFNLDTKRYITIPSGDIKIKVLPPDPNSPGAQVYTPQSQVKQTENDIRYIKKGEFQLVRNETEFFNSSAHILLLLLPVLALGGGLFARRNYIHNNSNIALVKERKAVKIARKQLVNAEKLMQQNSKDAFYTEILMALNSYIGNKLTIPVADLSRETIHRTLSQKQVDSQLSAKLISTLETSEYAKYAPGAVSGDLQSVYKDTVDLITQLEEQLNKKVS